MKSQINEVALQGIEFWSNVCEEEISLSVEAEEAREQGRAPENVSRHYARGMSGFGGLSCNLQLDKNYT